MKKIVLIIFVLVMVFPALALCDTPDAGVDLSNWVQPKKGDTVIIGSGEFVIIGNILTFFPVDPNTNGRNISFGAIGRDGKPDMINEGKTTEYAKGLRNALLEITVGKWFAIEAVRVDYNRFIIQKYRNVPDFEVWPVVVKTIEEHKIE